MQTSRCVNCGLIPNPADTECRRCGTSFAVYPPRPDVPGAMPRGQGQPSGQYSPSYGQPGTVFPGVYNSQTPMTGSYWREGSKLVVQKSARLPDRCIKCNVPTGGRYINRKLTWLNPLWYLLLLAGVIGGVALVVIGLVVRKTANVDIALCETDSAKHRNMVVLASVLAVIGVAMLVLAISLESPEAGVLGAILLLVALVLGIAKGQLISVTKIDNDYVWIGRVCKEFLSSLPLSR